MPKKPKDYTPEQQEMGKFLEYGCAQLDKEMQAAAEEHASLFSQWLLWEMATTGKSFDDVSIDLCRRFFKSHQVAICIGAGREVAEHIDQQNAAA